MSQTHAAELEAVVSSVSQGTACTVLTGDGGIGKTSVLNAAVARLAVGLEPISIIKVCHPLPLPLEFQRLIGAPLGLVDADRMTPNEIARRLAAEQGSGEHSFGLARRVVLMVDDAHRLPPATVLYLRLVSDLFCIRTPLLQVVLAGRRPLLETLLRPELGGRFVDNAFHVELKPLTAAEMSHYIALRVGASGGTLKDRFGRGALSCVIDYAEGIPRRADQVIERAMHRDANGQSRPITLKTLREIEVDTRSAGLPGGRALWMGAAAVAVVAWLVVGLLVWQGGDRSSTLLSQASRLADLVMGRSAPPAAAAPSAPPASSGAPAPSVAGAAVPPAPDAPPPAAANLPADPVATAAAADAEIARLMRAADAQIAAGHISGPADDNVILTFQRLNEVIADASQDGRRMVETMNTHFANQARLAEQTGHPEEARRLRQFAGGLADAPAAAPAPAGAPPATVEVQPTAPPSRGLREVALPQNAPIRLSLMYSRNSPDADTRAATAAAAMRDAGFQVGKPYAGDRRATTLVVRYFFAEDRDGAAVVARQLSGLIGQTAAIELARRDPMPVPGTIEALIP